MTKQEYEAKRASGRSMGFLPIAEIVNDSMIKDEYIASLEAVIAAKDAEISQLQADNISFVEQMNQIQADNISLVEIILQMNQKRSCKS